MEDKGIAIFAISAGLFLIFSDYLLQFIKDNMFLVLLFGGALVIYAFKK